VNQKAASNRAWEITIDSNWIMTVVMGLAFVTCGTILGWNIRNLLLDRVDHPVSLYYVIGFVSYFALAYSFPAKSLKVAFLLLGTNMVVRSALYYLHASTTVQHSAWTVCSIASQIAYTIILVVIVQWFRSVVRWNQSPEQGPDS
jgi:hypothetical protein